MTASLLDTIVAAARRAADAREAETPRDALERLIATRTPNGAGFRAALDDPGIRVIAECKRRSPSKGVLRQDYDPVALARGYAAAGAAAISVLTEPTFFDGALEHLRAVRGAVSTPLLRKDFLVTEYQVIEAAASGADAILLIVSALDDAGIRRLSGVASAYGLATLVEVHDRGELIRAVDAGANVIGVNSRNLRTLEVHTSVLEELGPMIPGGVIAVAESGLRTADDLRRLGQVRYNAFLIGERFMTQPDPGAMLASLIAEASEA